MQSSGMEIIGKGREGRELEWGNFPSSVLKGG
jgi:hypothetical protein